MYVVELSDAIKLAATYIMPWGSNISYHFATTLPSYYVGESTGFNDMGGIEVEYNSANFASLSSEEQALVQQNFAEISAFAAVTFTNSASENADIVFGALKPELEDAAAYAYLPEANDVGMDGDIWLAGPYRLPNTDGVIKDYMHSVIPHEIGHALGLVHPFDPEAGFGFDEISPDLLNSGQFTIMAYAEHPQLHRDVTEFQLGDIASLQYLYGPNTSSAAGNTIWNTWQETLPTGATVDRAFCIWDAGGNDTIDASAFSSDCAVDLRPGCFSSIGETTGLENSGWTFWATGNGNVSIAFGAYIENAIGGSGNDAMIGNMFSNNLSGGIGNDTMFAEGRSISETLPDLDLDRLDGDYRPVLKGHIGDAPELLPLAQNDTLIGDAGHDHLYGGRGNDMLDAGDGADSLWQLGGADTMKGGTGDDSYFVDTAGAVLIEGAASGQDLVLAKINYTLQANFEDLWLDGGELNVNGTGNSLGNRIDGNGGSNKLSGLGGNDSLFGNDGKDTLAGGAGDDYCVLDGALGGLLIGGPGSDRLVGFFHDGTVADYSAATGAITVNLEKGLTVKTGNWSGQDEISAAEVIGTRFYDTLIGNWAQNRLVGGNGNDTLNGGTNADTLSGGGGNDIYYVDSGGDKIIELAGNGTDKIFTGISYSLKKLIQTENLTLTGTGNLNATGNSLNNVLAGNSGNNILSGAAGADTMGGSGGNDIYNVDSGKDKIIEIAGNGTDKIVTGISYSLGKLTQVENLTLTGTANLIATGNALDNVLVGNAGKNLLVGGRGQDTLTGAAGNDVFDFNAASDSTASTDQADIIMDFVQGADKIDLSGIDANLGASGNQAFTFISTAEFSHTAGELRISIDDGHTFAMTDIDGDGTADLTIHLIGTINLSATDFAL